MPARAFYTGVAKLVKVEDNTIYLGFLHDNTLAQAKTQTKISQLNQAISNTYSDFKVEFIKIDNSTKIIEVKPKMTRVQPQYQNAAQNSAQNGAQYQSQPIKQNENHGENQNPKAQEEEKQTSAREKKQYTPEVQNMIEQFNGKIID